MLDHVSDRRRAVLRRRLEREFDDDAAAIEIVEALDDTLVEEIHDRCGGDMATSPLLAYRPPTIADEAVESLWILAFGHRFVADDGRAADAIAPMSDLSPGPVNEALAGEAARFVRRHPVPIVAQWEVARVLADLGVVEVISVEPEVAEDGSITYLSTIGVVEKGLRLASEAGIPVGRAGVLGHRDHASRCVMVAESAGMRAGVPVTARLPSEYDQLSGQPWTRSRTRYVPVDLAARAQLS